MNGHLKACPDSPNCVSSVDPNPERRVDALPLPRSPGGELVPDPIARLGEILSLQSRVRVMEVREDYLHAVFISRLLRFRDDVEFLLDREAGLLQVRSASRVGYSDLGANRARVERLRGLLAP